MTMKKTNNPYIIAFDMDGTLLNSKKEITFKTRHYLRKLIKQGHHIVIASGRPPRSIERYYKQLKLDTPAICYNGEYTFSPCDKNFKTIHYTFQKDMVLEVLNKMGANVLNVMCEGDKDIWVDKEDEYLGKFFWYEGMELHKGNLNEILDKDTCTCIIRCPKEYKDTHEIDEILKKWPEILPVFWIGSPYFELHHKLASKGAGLEEVAKYYNIPRERIIAFGDATNDIEMFEYAKTSVMMKNAKFDISDKATMVSLKDNDHDGIYYTLKKILNA